MLHRTQVLEACSILVNEGCRNFSLIIIGDGEQRQEFESYAKEGNLSDLVRFEGWVQYDNLGAYLENTDILVFPTLEDIWGMVVLEAMLFSKPVLCSKEAGVAETIVSGENGYVFDPYNPSEIAKLMRHYIDNPHLINYMGSRSKDMIAYHNPEAAAEHFSKVILFALQE